MTIKVRTSDDYAHANMTSYRGEFTADYKELVRLFGEPLEGDGYKVQAEWIVILQDECGDEYVATIYDWKQGFCYWGIESESTAKEDVKEWHIGGRSYHGPMLLKQYIEQKRDEAVEQAWLNYSTDGMEGWDTDWLEEGK